MTPEERKPYKTDALMAKFDEILRKLRELDLRGTTPLRETIEQLKDTVLRRLLSDEQELGAAFIEKVLTQAEAVSAPILVQRARQAGATDPVRKGRIMVMVILMIAAAVLITSVVNGKSLIKVNLDWLVAFFNRESSLPPAKKQTTDAAAVSTASASGVDTASTVAVHTASKPILELTNQVGGGTAAINTSAVAPSEPETSTAEVNTSSTPTAEQPREQVTEAPEPGSQAPAVETEEVSHVQPLELVNGPVMAQLQADGTWLARIHLRRGVVPEEIDDRPGQCEGTRRNGPPGIRVNAISVVRNDDGQDCYLMNVTAFGGADPSRLRAKVSRVP